MEDSQKDLITVKQVKSFMQELGFYRGFSKDSVNRKLGKGQFPKPHCRSSNTRYWAKYDISDWVHDGMQKVA